MRRAASHFAQHGLDVVPIRIEHERSIIAGWITGRRIAQPGRPMVNASGRESSPMKRINLRATASDERRVLPDAVRVKTIDPKTRMLDAVGHAISATMLGNLHDST